eukprot:4237362-Karenia_brevis.AAC.1
MRRPHRADLQILATVPWRVPKNTSKITDFCSRMQSAGSCKGSVTASVVDGIMKDIQLDFNQILTQRERTKAGRAKARRMQSDSMQEDMDGPE